MIKLSDAAILALTKLRTRRVRTLITLIISSLLFGCLVAALLVAKGALDSINKFNSIGFGNRYIVQAMTPSPIATVLTNPSIMSNATQIYNQTIVAKKAAAKKLGITYDSTTEINPIINANAQYNIAATLNPSSPSAQTAISEYLSANPPPGINALEKLAMPYHPSNFYETTFPNVDGTLTTMFGGVEDFIETEDTSSSQSQNYIEHDVLQNQNLEFAPPNLTNPFLLPGSDKTTPADADDIPIVMPYDNVQYMLGLQPIANSASSATKLARIKQVYSDATNMTFSACYRNSASTSQIQDAITDASISSTSKNSPYYVKPDLIYGLPAPSSCGAAVVLSDTETASEKQDDKLQAQFDAMFGQDDTPTQQKIE